MSKIDLYWDKVEQEQEYSCSIFQIHRARHRRHDGKEADFYLLQSPDWVNIIPITINERKEPCFVLVRQYRPGAGKLSLEFPGGLVDPGESCESAAGRELREETGYCAGELLHIGTTNPNPAFMTNTMRTYIARDLSLCSPQDLDEDEHIEVFPVPIKDIVNYRVPEFQVNGIMLIALGWYMKWAENVESGVI